MVTHNSSILYIDFSWISSISTDMDETSMCDAGGTVYICLPFINRMKKDKIQ